MDDENRFNDERRFLKFWIVVSVSAAVIIGLAVFPGRSLYRNLKEKHGAAQAQAFFAKGDYRNAALSVRQVLAINPNNVEACRIITELNDLAHSPATLDWCQRLVKLSPAVTNQLLLASIGLRYQGPPHPLASQVLEDLSASATNLPDFHVLSAQLDLSLRRMTDAEKQFEAACQLQPTNQLFQLNLAVIRLGSTNAAGAEAARAKLKEFTGDPDLGVPALRSLIADRLLHEDNQVALNYSTQLLAAAQANLGDRLQHLDILKRLHSPTLSAQLNGLQRDATTNSVMAAQTAAWMEANGLMLQAVAWLNALPSSVQTQIPVRLAFVDYYMNTTNWTALRKLTSTGDWGEMDFLRLAFLSRAWNQMGEPLVADGNWRSAVSEAGGRSGALTALLDLANRWQLTREREELLWHILQTSPDATWAENELAINYPNNARQRYIASGNTKALYRLCLLNLPRAPQNVMLKNDLAATALLLETNLAQAYQWATEVYIQSPTNADCVSTYAYAMHLQGRNQEGLAALQRLKPAQLNAPSVALYYGTLLSAVGKMGEAAPYLQIAGTKGRLLPEERQLLIRTGWRN